ncbi:MAG: hypothetical protein NC548_51545 [Lachnospiraceae bacterium]|nr:hypothetical protein [Lachnospiraceae bacterium]
MIKNQDRSGWFGASDTAMIMSNWTTDTFKKWWMQKLAFIKNNYKNKQMLAGTYYEHEIAQAISEHIGEKLTLDRQIKKRRLKLRVNLDSETKSTIYEIKTHTADKTFRLPKNYIMKVRVQMWATKKKGVIVVYPLTEEHYKNYFLPINKELLEFYEIEQDKDFIKDYLSKLKYLSACLRRGIFPVKRI